MKVKIVKHYIITDELIDRLYKHSKPGVFKSEYEKVLRELKKNKIPEGTMTVRCLGFNADGKNFKIDIPISFNHG
jgi:hypothetical protein